MSREDGAIGIIVFIIIAIAAIIVTSWRYRRYERRVAKGHRNAKPVWKPFWIN